MNNDKHIIKVTLDDESYQKLTAEATEEGISLQDLIRIRLLGEDMAMFTPAEAERRAIAKYAPGEGFSLPNLYTGEEWAKLGRGAAGIFGRQFNKYIEGDNSMQKIEYVDIVNRRAQYRMK